MRFSININCVIGSVIVVLLLSTALHSQTGCVATASLDVVINNCNTGIANNVDNQLLQIVPNPSTGTIKLVFPTDRTVEKLEIFNSIGQLVLAQYNESVNLQSNLYLEKLPKGVYLVQLTSSNKIYVDRVILQ